MHSIGFSTGSLALGDFRRALRMLEGTSVDAVELSALRMAELPALVEAADSLHLNGFRHVSVHAPSAIPSEKEAETVRLLSVLVERGWPVVLHPDAIHSHEPWQAFGSQLWIENMDKRKRTGRTATELSEVFRCLPEAGLCLDLAHARQYDPSMLEAYRILMAHRARLRQVHLSDVSSRSTHTRLSYGAIHDFQEVAALIPDDIPVILESPTLAAGIEKEIRRAREVFRSRSSAVS